MPLFVVQEHHASRLHWDFRLEIEGVLKSWALPKGPSLDPRDKRLAIQVPDHDLIHADYEGIIPKGNYGAGPVLIWDSGTFISLSPQDAAEGWRGGRFVFALKGRILRGEFSLIRMRGDGRQQAWLLMKKDDDHAVRDWKVPVLLTLARRRQLKEAKTKCDVREH